MIDHLSVVVSDYEKSKAFYLQGQGSSQVRQPISQCVPRHAA
jgi:catechol 2,3-dioxygenase-like lactoylglutathione lyase family enzyme